MMGIMAHLRVAHIKIFIKSVFIYKIQWNKIKFDLLSNDKKIKLKKKESSKLNFKVC